MGRVCVYLRNNVLGLVAVFIALSGSAYAANSVGSADVINESLQSADLKDNAAVGSPDVINDSVANGGLATQDLRAGAVTSSDLKDGEVMSSDVRDDTFANGGLKAADLAPNSVGASELGDGQITSADVHDINEYTFEGGLKWEDLSAGSVNSVQVINNSLDGSDIDEHMLQDVPIGGRFRASGSATSAAANSYTNATVDCPDDSDGRDRVVVGGGYVANYGMRAVASYPIDRDTWKVTVYNDYNVTDATVQAWAVCVYDEFFFSDDT